MVVSATVLKLSARPFPLTGLLCTLRQCFSCEEGFLAGDNNDCVGNDLFFYVSLLLHCRGFEDLCCFSSENPLKGF